MPSPLPVLESRGSWRIASDIREISKHERLKRNFLGGASGGEIQ